MKQRIIIFEGPDGVGKTDLALKLYTITGIKYFKNPKEREIFLDPEISMYATTFGGTILAQFLKQTGYSAIIDRAHASEFAYAGAFDRKIDFGAIHEIDQIFSKLGAVIVYCWKNEYKNYSDDLVALNDIHKIKQHYNKFFKITKCNVIYINTTDENSQEQLTTLVRELNKLGVIKWNV
jgi:hypothetical protein